MFSEKFIEIKNWFLRYERHISSASLILGFVIDNLTLQRIDLLFENLVLLFYISVSVLGIVIFNLSKAGVLRINFLEKINFFIPVIIQFAFGGLFSGFVVFYSRSASLSASWPFLLILVGILITGELVKGFYSRISYQLTVFYLAILSYLIFVVPIVVGHMNSFVFVLSGLLSLLVFYGIYRFFELVLPEFFAVYKKGLISRVVFIFITVFVFYFTNILPPIPLSLKDGGVYHNVVRIPEGYLLSGEEKSFFDRLKTTENFHLSPGGRVYFFSSVFAPTDLKVNIVHEWQYYDEINKRWITANTISFPIVGGNDGGYRGYSFKENVFDGKWRVNVKTSRGQIVGRVEFRIIYGGDYKIRDIIR